MWSSEAIGISPIGSPDDSVSGAPLAEDAGVFLMKFELPEKGICEIVDEKFKAIFT